MIANSCTESTGRFVMVLGYHVTLVRDAAAAFSAEGMPPPSTSTVRPTPMQSTTAELIEQLTA